MSKYGLKFEKKTEDCVEFAKTHHVFLTEDTKRSFVRNEGRHHNLLIEGENYQALRVLNYTHAGKVDVIYIDPPYNTGNRDFVYNDAFVDSEDTFRHSKWLSFMERRLKLARNLLSDRGVIFISIDDNEFAQLKLLCDEVFGEENFIANLIWKKKATNGGISKGGFGINVQHEYVLFYVRNKEHYRINGVPGSKELDAKYKFEDDKGKYRLVDLAGYGLDYQPSMDYAIESPDGGKIRANDVMGVKYDARWRWSEKTYRENLHLIVWVNGKPKTKTYMNGERQLVHPSSILDDKDLLANTDSSVEDALGSKMFDYAKPVELIKRLLFVASQKDSVVLDFFAGSGTTGQAVAELNKEDGGTRQFILITNNDKSDKLPQGICHQVTFPRLEKTIGDENLKYYSLSFLPLAKDTTARIEQLELQHRLLPTLCMMNDTHCLVEENKHSFIFTNHDNTIHLGVMSYTTTKQQPIDPAALLTFRKHLNTYLNAKLEVNRPRRGYAENYYSFMSKLHV
jgi:adenine-specific DNA-methyltransferase